MYVFHRLPTFRSIQERFLEILDTTEAKGIIFLARLLTSHFSQPFHASQLLNYAEFPVDLFWVKRTKGKVEYIKQSKHPIRHSKNTKINCNYKNEFVVKYSNPKRATSGNATFTKRKYPDETVRILIDPETNQLVAELKTKPEEFVDKVKNFTNYCRANSNVSSCMEDVVKEEYLKLLHQTEKKEMHLRSIADDLADYACKDLNLNYSKPKTSIDITIDNQTFDADEYLSTTNVKIWYIENFVSEEECSILEANADQRYHHVRGYNESGDIVYPSTHRAQVAQFSPSTELEKDLSTELLLRNIAALDALADLDLPIDGQEQLSLFKYENDDEQQLQCDGCHGQSYKRGDVIATGTIFCQVSAYLYLHSVFSYLMDVFLALHAGSRAWRSNDLSSEQYLYSAQR
jgi:hypothetical protein